MSKKIWVFFRNKSVNLINFCYVENFDIAKINQIYRFISKKHPNFFGHKIQE